MGPRPQNIYCCESTSGEWSFCLELSVIKCANMCVLEPWTKWGHNKMHIDKWECCYSQRDRYPFLHRRLEKETADPFFWFHDGWGVSNLNTFCKQHKQNAYAGTNALCTVQKQVCFIYILDSSNSSSFTFWTSQFTSSSNVWCTLNRTTHLT